MNTNIKKHSSKSFLVDNSSLFVKESKIVLNRLEVLSSYNKLQITKDLSNNTINVVLPACYRVDIHSLMCKFVPYQGGFNQGKNTNYKMGLSTVIFKVISSCEYLDIITGGQDV
jgi:hypothetical protein